MALALGACGGLKYDLLRGTSIPNPPPRVIKIAIKDFKVGSKASVVDPRAATKGADNLSTSSQATNAMAETGGELIKISRPSRIEDLSGAVLRQLRQEQVRIFNTMDIVKAIEDVRTIDNPFELVTIDDPQVDLEISGKILINSQRISKKFSRMTKNVEIQLIVRDIKNDKVNEKKQVRAGINMIFNSKELEEAMAIAVITNMTQKILF